LLTAAIALAAAAAAVSGIPIIGHAIAIVLLIIALMLLLAAVACLVVAIVYQSKINTDRNKIRQDQAAAQAAVSQIERACPVCCWPNMQINTC
jgi:hypothetical protein